MQPFIDRITALPESQNPDIESLISSNFRTPCLSQIVEVSVKMQGEESELVQWVSLENSRLPRDTVAEVDFGDTGIDRNTRTRAAVSGVAGHSWGIRRHIQGTNTPSSCMYRSRRATSPLRRSHGDAHRLQLREEPDAVPAHDVKIAEERVLVPGKRRDAEIAASGIPVLMPTIPTSTRRANSRL